VRLRFRTPGDVLWRLGETLNRGWFATSRRVRAETGNPVEVEFALPGIRTPIRTRGRVLAVLEAGTRKERLALVAFNPLTAGAKRRIGAIMLTYRCPPPSLSTCPRDKARRPTVRLSSA
jgi:hypothetical protein